MASQLTEGHSEHHPACPQEAAQSFLWAVWAEPGVRTEKSFLFHMIHSPTLDFNIICYQSKKVNKNFRSTSPQQATPLKQYSNTHLHIFQAEMIWNVFLQTSDYFFFLFLYLYKLFKVPCLNGLRKDILPEFRFNSKKGEMLALFWQIFFIFSKMDK